MNSTELPHRSSRDKKPSGWYQDFEVNKPKKKTSPGIEARNQDKPPLPPKPPKPQLSAERPPDGALEDTEEVLLIATQEEEEQQHAKGAPVVLGRLLDDKELEEQLNNTPGLAGLVELATTPVGTPMMAGAIGQAPPALDLGANVTEVPDAEKRVTIWNPYEKRKLSGNSAPFRKNLDDYLKKHPDWEEYWGQDLDENGRKLFPRKRRRTSADPSPALSGKPQPTKGGNSMMAGLLQLATEEAGPGVTSPILSPRALGSLKDTQEKELNQRSELLGSVLDAVHDKVESKVTEIKQSNTATVTAGSGEQTALALVQDVVVDAIEESAVLALGAHSGAQAQNLGGAQQVFGGALNVASVSLASN